MAIIKHVVNVQNLTLELISVHQTINDDPNDGVNGLERNHKHFGH